MFPPLSPPDSSGSLPLHHVHVLSLIVSCCVLSKKSTGNVLGFGAMCSCRLIGVGIGRRWCFGGTLNEIVEMDSIQTAVAFVENAVKAIAPLWVVRRWTSRARRRGCVPGGGRSSVQLNSRWLLERRRAGRGPERRSVQVWNLGLASWSAL